MSVEFNNSEPTYAHISAIDMQAEALLHLDAKGTWYTYPIPSEVRAALENLRNVIALTGADKPRGDVMLMPRH